MALLPLWRQNDTPMDFDFKVIVASIIFSTIGFVYFSYGKRLTNLPITATGMALMIYGYFTPSLLACVLIGAFLSALPFVFKWW